MKTKITHKQRSFVDAYLSNGMNATKAAIQVGYSTKSASAIGSENLTKLNILEEIERRQILERQTFKVTRESLLRELEAVKKNARETQNFGAYIRAIEVQAKMLGLFEPPKAPMEVPKFKVCFGVIS